MFVFPIFSLPSQLPRSPWVRQESKVAANGDMFSQLKHEGYDMPHLLYALYMVTKWL